jgi:sporulation protein YlmC with PRC-barrel domain
MAAKKGRAPKRDRAAKKDGAESDEPGPGEAGESSVRLPPGSIRVLTERDKDWLPPEPAGQRGRGGGPSTGVTEEKEGPAGEDDKALIGKRVVDTEGLELGFVDEVSRDELTVGEGPFSEWLRIKRNYIGDVGEEVRLLEPLQEMLQDIEVFDSDGRSVGWVTDVIATGDVVDGLIVKSPRGNLFVLLEDICSIGGKLTLDITRSELMKQAANRRKS